jgi:hypothetical protein
MWNKRLSYFMIVRVRHKPVNFILPVPLFIFEDLLQAMGDVVTLWESFFPRQKLPGLVIAHVLALLHEIRQIGSWRLVELSDQEIQISISFY